jgi:peroxiredoxin
LRLTNHKLANEAGIPHVGLAVPPIWTQGVNGDSARVGVAPNDGHQVLLVFNTTCAFCQASIRAWNSVAQTAGRRAPRTQVLGVSLDPQRATQQYIAAQGIEFPVVLMSGIWREVYRFTIVPSIVVIDSTGHVTFVRIGVLNQAEGIDSVVRVVTASRRRP